MYNETLSMISHQKIDILIRYSLISSYRINQEEIEIKEAFLLLKDTSYKSNSYVDNMLLLNHISRKICHQSNIMLGENKSLIDYKDFREKISQRFFNFSFDKAENAIQQIIMIHLAELLQNKKYQYYEELSAVIQYFSSLAVMFGIEQTTLNQDVKEVVGIYQQSLGDKISHCFKRGKIAFQYLSKYKIVNIELLNIALDKVFGSSIYENKVKIRELYCS
jgi:hypothetical protein